MTPTDLTRRREALGLTRTQLGALLWVNPQSGRVTITNLESGHTRLTRRTAAWLDLELTALERSRPEIAPAS